ncbi:MAG: NADH-quinone oxidoreductase subunit F, partial [Chloroflexi bacterium]|nr:NADH-quinone oxidoreductase subunit F [Chloroflexota bacterium]
AGLLDGLTVDIRRGAGGYVCGEESVILESIEGRRAVPRLKPPYPTERGLWGRPTAINSVETLANLPDIFEYGPGWFREVGGESTPGTKLIQLSGAFRNRGVIELPLGTPVSEIIELAEPTQTLAGVTMGGPSGGFLAPEHFDTPIAPGAMDGHGALLGAGGIIGIPQSFGIERALQVWAEYNANESCGKCTPCREGSGRMAEALADGNWADVEALIPLITAGSLCGLGQMAANPITSARHQFGG